MRLLRRRFQELPALGDHSTIQDVGIEATELLREALAQGAAGEHEVVLRLTGLGQARDRRGRALEEDVAALARQRAPT